MESLKNKKILSGIAVIAVVLLIVGGGLFFFKNQSSDRADESENEMIDSSDLPELTPEEVGMIVTIRKDKKALMFELTKASKIEKVEYTIEYEASTEEGSANQGIFGEMNIGADGITKTDFREFGTCSAGKCRYDNVTSDITINLKITMKDGKEYQVKKVVKLSESSDE
jgi:hypothetical protein